MSNRKKVVFLTGTRADFGKIKALVQVLDTSSDFEPYLFVTGMHLMHEYGYTAIEIDKSGFKNIHRFENHTSEETMDLTLAKTIQGFSSYISQLQPDLIVVHGDRVEALAGAITGSLNNILVAHIEGGEVSGTIDELIRHSVSKLAHLHFVSNKEAKQRLVQMGELPDSVQIIGSPDIDIMFSDQLPSLAEAKAYYELTFEEYAVSLFHPVTTEVERFEEYAKSYVEALIRSGQNYLVVYPNNDLGSTHILKAIEPLKTNPKFRVLPSLRFEYFLVLLKNASFIAGNSSAGIREAPYYGIPTLNVGSRQHNRANSASIVNTAYDVDGIMQGLEKIDGLTIEQTDVDFGSGDSASAFLKVLSSLDFGGTAHQKHFQDLS